VILLLSEVIVYICVKEGMKRRVGCIIVKDCRVIATGYNGSPTGIKNCNQGGCERCNSNSKCGSSLDICICMHAEEVFIALLFRMRCLNRVESD
jgi:deoxycytidylate deaminase